MFTGLEYIFLTINDLLFNYSLAIQLLKKVVLKSKGRLTFFCLPIGRR